MGKDRNKMVLGRWFWLSFADADGQHIATSLVGPARSREHAVRLAATKGCSLTAEQCDAGARVTVFDIPPQNVKRIPPDYRNRLLTFAEIEELQRVSSEARGAVQSGIVFVRETSPGIYKGELTPPKK